MSCAGEIKRVDNERDSKSQNPLICENPRFRQFSAGLHWLKEHGKNRLNHGLKNLYLDLTIKIASPYIRLCYLK